MIVVPTPEPNCPATRALRMEGHDPLEVLCTGPHTYGAEFASIWNIGRPFVICEWDIIPWPGAVDALMDCPEPRCTHRYPISVGNLANSFGIGKYHPRGLAPEVWAHTEWRLLDGFVLPEVKRRLGRPHIHEPPVAHARDEAP